jgi:hypothetical protein
MPIGGTSNIASLSLSNVQMGEFYLVAFMVRHTTFGRGRPAAIALCTQLRAMRRNLTQVSPKSGIWNELIHENNGIDCPARPNAFCSKTLALGAM